MPRGNLGVTQSPIQWVKGAFYQGVKRPGRLADYIPSSRSEAKNRWTCISISPFTFMMWTRDIFIFCTWKRTCNILAWNLLCFRVLGETNCKVYCLFHSSCSKRKEKRSGSCVKVDLPWLLRGPLARLSWPETDVAEDVKGNIRLVLCYMCYAIMKTKTMHYPCGWMTLLLLRLWSSGMWRHVVTLVPTLRRKLLL